MSLLSGLQLLACVILVAHALFARVQDRSSSSAKGDKPIPDLKSIAIRAMVVAPLVLIAFWLTLMPIVVIAVWAFVIGDNEHWFWRASPVIVLILALLPASPFFYRAAKRDVGPRFFFVQGFYALTVIALWAAVRFQQETQYIKGSDPLQAARAIVRDWGENPDDYTFQPAQDFVGFPKDPVNYRTLLVVGPDEPRGRITVHRRFGSWWQQVGVQRFPPSSQELARAREWHAKGGNEKGVRLILQNILQDYPNTPAAKEAEGLLREVGER